MRLSTTALILQRWVFPPPDDKTLVVELEVPVSFFPSLMYFPTFYPINEAFYTSLEDGTYGTSPETFLSNGAFVLESYTPGTANLTLKKNPDYWDADRVQLAGIKYQVVGSSDNAASRRVRWMLLPSAEIRLPVPVRMLRSPRALPLLVQATCGIFPSARRKTTRRAVCSPMRTCVLLFPTRLTVKRW